MAANQVESLVKWYLRFNGYFTIPNFTVHPDTKKGREAEVDFIAVRFPFSEEQAGQYEFERDDDLIVEDAIDFLLIEVKSSECVLNKTWTDPERHNIEYALQWIGDLPGERIEEIASHVYKKGTANYRYPDDRKKRVVRLVSIGRYIGEESKNQKENMPDVLQIELLKVVSFVKSRLTLGSAKPHRENWDSYIQDFTLLAELDVDIRILLQWTLGKTVRL